MANQKHTFDFEGILNMDINQKNWRDIKQKLDNAFGELKIGIEEGMAKADAEKYVKMLNQVFDKVQMPDIGVEDLKDQFDQVAESFTKAIASLHNIDISSLKNIEGSLDHIATQVDKIVDKVGKGAPKAAKSAVLSVKQLDDVLGKLGDSAKDIEGSLSFSIEGDVKKQGAALRKISNELEKLEENRIKAFQAGETEDIQNWFKRQQAMTKYVRAYESYVKVAKKPNKDLTELYNKLLPKSYDARINLQNLSDRRAGTYSEHKEPWAKEETLKKVLGVLQNGIKVEDKEGNKSPKDPPKVPPNDPPKPQKNQDGNKKPKTNEPDLPKTKMEGILLEVIEAAKKESKVEWKNAREEDKEKFIEKHLWSKLTLSPQVDEDTKFDLEQDLIDYSNKNKGSKLSKIASSFEQWSTSLELEFDRATDEVRSAVEIYASIEETGSDQSFDMIDRIFKENPILGDLIQRDKNNEWQALKKKLLSGETEPSPVQTGIPKSSTTSETINSGELSEISNKIDKLATGTNVAAAKEAIVTAIKDGKTHGELTVDVSSIVEAMTDVLNKIQESQNKKDSVSVLLENNDLLGQLVQLSKEGGLFYNSETGFSSDVVEGGTHRTETPMNVVESLSKLYDTRVHKHNFDIAAPSFSGNDNDFNAWLKVFDHIKKQVIVSNKEILSFDFSSLTKDTLKTIANLYSEAASKIDAEFNGYIKDGKVGDMFGSLGNMDEQMQRRLRESLELIMKDYSGVMTSHRLPSEVTDNKQSHLLEAIPALTEAIKQLSGAQNNSDVVSALQGLSERLGSTVSQEDTLQGVKSVLEAIKSSGFNVDISPEGITTAIKEALYAKEIAVGYEKVDFDRAFSPNFDGYWMNQFTGEILDTMEEAETDFNKYMKDLYASKDGTWTGTKEEMLQEIARMQNNTPDMKNDWAQVIVEAINAQGGKIVEAIKVVLPQNASNNAGDNFDIDEAKVKNAFDVLTNTLLQWNDITGKTPGDFFRGLQKNDLTVDAFRTTGVDDALRDLGLITDSGKISFVMPDTGIRNLGVAIADRLVVTSQDVDNVGNITELQAKLDEASKLGAAVPRILGLAQGDLRHQWANGAIFQLQTRSPGVNIASSKAHGEFAGASPEQIDKLIHTFEVMSKVGLFPDFIGDNVLFDDKRGFSLIDIETKNIHREDMDTPEAMVERFLKNIDLNGLLSGSDFDEFSQKMRARMALPPEQRLVDEFGNLKTQSGVASVAKITPTMDEGAVAKVVQENVAKTPATVKVTPVVDNQLNIDDDFDFDLDTLSLDDEDYDWSERDEFFKNGGADTSNKEVENLELIKIAVDNVAAAVDLKTKAFTDEETEVQRVTVEEMENLGMLEHKILTVKTTLENLMNNIRSGADDIGTGLNNIVVNVNYPEKSESEKFTIDEVSLEATLNKVFSNILNPPTQQNDGESKKSPWALESTLKSVKTVLNNIQINTAKFGTIEISNVDTITGTALDNRLSEIKSVLESINQKIVDGGKIFNRDGAKQAYKEAQDAGPKQTSQSNMFKSLINDYKTMGKLAAQYADDGNLETKAMLDNLKEEIARKRRSLKLTMDENASLREKYSIAFDAEKRLLEAEKAQEEIDRKRKQQDKDDKAAWKKQVKDAQRATGINAATSAANAGDQTVLRAIGTEGVSQDIENKAKELSDQIKALRVLRDEIDKKGEQASDKDRDDLGKQISKVKELKAEVDGYLKIHEKYSGDNATQFDIDTSNFGAVGTDQYWNNITTAIKGTETGKVTIKGLNAETGELTGTTKIAANTFAEWSATVDPITGKLSILRTGIKKTETLVESITRKTREIFTYFSGSSIIFKAFNELKKGIQHVREIDLALTELKKVTDETEESYDKFLKTAAKTGARLGTTISAVTEATATFAKLGYTMEQSTEMAEAAIVYKNVGDNIASTGDAADSIISTMKGFGMEASESMVIVDKFNEVGE